MATIPLTLAALATSAVPGLTVFGVRPHDSGDGYHAAVVASENAELLVRVPRTQAAEVEQSGELLGLAALTEGSRAGLPFTAPETLGMTRAGDTRAVVSTMPDGERFDAEDLTDDAKLLQSIAESVGAVHDLPHSVAQQGGLPVRSAQDLRLAATRIIDRAVATRLLPETVLRRWQSTVETAEFWDFAPTIVHGSLDAERLVVEDDRIIAVLGWSEFGVGDPAADLAWLLVAGSDVLDGVLARYARRRNTGSLSHMRVRAALYHELDVAKWLLHGVDSHDSSIVDDAVAMMDRMVGAVGPLALALTVFESRSPLDDAAVEALLDETPEVVDHLSDTAAYEALDEDRMFGVDTDFIEPLSSSDAPDGSDADAAAEAATESPADSPTEQITEPLDPADLPEGDVSDAGAGAADAREDASPAADPHDRDLPDRR